MNKLVVVLSLLDKLILRFERGNYSDLNSKQLDELRRYLLDVTVTQQPRSLIVNLATVSLLDENLLDILLSLHFERQNNLEKVRLCDVSSDLRAELRAREIEGFFDIFENEEISLSQG